MAVLAKPARAKFVVIGVQKHTPEMETVTATATYDPTPGTENNAFWQSTPNGRLDITITNPELLGSFKQGQHYYIDFRPA